MGSDGKEAAGSLNLELASTTMTSKMKEYCRNNECRRNILLKDFDDSGETETLGCSRVVMFVQFSAVIMCYDYC